MILSLCRASPRSCLRAGDTASGNAGGLTIRLARTAALAHPLRVHPQEESRAAAAGHQTRLSGHPGHARARRGAVDRTDAVLARQGAVDRARERRLGFAASLETGLCRAAAQAS